MEHGPDLEARARAARYSVLPPDVLTGHTADDQAETVVLNLVRGAGLDGLRGMPRARRPLIQLRRSETHALCDEVGLTPVTDPMNASHALRRNRVRHELLPLLDAIACRDVAAVISRQGDLLTDDAALLDSGWVTMDMVPSIPVVTERPSHVTYGPLAETPVDPDVVVIAGRPGRVMLLLEAAGRAGVGVQPALLGRPTCMALPAALTGGSVASTGCIGNRVYTDLGDDELYVAMPGRDVGRIVAELGTIVAANDSLADYHRQRRQTLASE